MAAIVEVVSQSGQTLYFTVHDSSGNLWNGSAFEAFSSANWATYVIAFTEQGTSGYYKGSFPAGIAAGKYTCVFYPTSVYGDITVGNSSIYWNGTIEEQGIGKVLVAYLLDKLAFATTGGTPPTIGSLFDRIMNKDSGQTYDQAIASLQAIQTGGTSGPTAVQIANQVWDTVLPGFHTVASSGSMLLQALVNILPATGPLSNFNPTSQTVNLGASQTGVTIGTVSALGAPALASILTQIRTALSTDTMSELASVPGATPTIYQALMLAYMSLRNEHTATSSEERIKNSAGSVVARASLADDGSTYTKGILT